MDLRNVTVGGVVNRAKTVVGKAVEKSGIVPEPEDFGFAPGRPAGFAEWHKRQQRRIGSSVAASWRMRVPAPDLDPCAIAVVVHCVEGDDITRLFRDLSAIPVPFDLFITSSAKRLVLDGERPPNLRREVFLPVANQGRSLLPLVTLVNADLLEPYELIVKLNAKEPTDEVLGSRESVQRILAAFASDPTLGSVAAAEAIQSGPDAWGKNRELVAALLQRFQLSLEDRTLQFAQNQTFWIRGFVVQGLRALQLSEWDFEDESGQPDGTTFHALQRAIGLLLDEAGYTLRHPAQLDVEEMAADGWRRFDTDTRGELEACARLVPLFSPRYQSHPDALGGVEPWIQVAASRPVFVGQAQPFLPDDLGFYDLSSPQALSHHYRLASKFGIDTFMFDYETKPDGESDFGPIEAHLSGDAPGSFCVAWNNGNLLLSASEGEMVTDSTTSISREVAHDFFDRILPLLGDERYLRVDGAPLLVVSNCDRMDDLRDVLHSWRERAMAVGLPGLVVLASGENDRTEDAAHPVDDSDVDGHILIPPMKEFTIPVPEDLIDPDEAFRGIVRRYDTLSRAVERSLLISTNQRDYPYVAVAHDDTAANAGLSDVMIGVNPFTFRRWLSSAVASVADRSRSNRLIFLHGWNDWSVTAVLEPSQRFGRTYLLAVRDVLYR